MSVTLHSIACSRSGCYYQSRSVASFERAGESDIIRGRKRAMGLEVLTGTSFVSFFLSFLLSYISRGYTRALARTAPVEPATAKPHGGSAAALDCADMVCGGCGVGIREGKLSCPAKGRRGASVLVSGSIQISGTLRNSFWVVSLSVDSVVSQWVCAAVWPSLGRMRPRYEVRAFGSSSLNCRAAGLRQ